MYLPGAQGEDGRTIPNTDSALLSFSMEKSKYLPIIIGVFFLYSLIQNQDPGVLGTS